jgi:hypothetical protein
MRPRLLGIIPCAGVLLLLTGCPNPNLYTTPRTLNPGDVQVQVVPEVIGVGYNQTTTTATGQTTTQGTSAVLPMVPTAGVRVGVADGFDFGARLTNLSTLSLDGKIRLIKGSVDLAVDPGLQGVYYSFNNETAGIIYFHVPLLVGFNLSENSTIVLVPGFVYAAATATVNNSNGGVNGVSSATGAMGRLGLGLDVRVSKKFAIHPEVTVMHQFSDLNAYIFVGGFGFNIGAQPDYSDLAGGGGGTPAPAPAPPPAQ